MRIIVCLCAVLSFRVLSAGERMNVSVCNQGQIPEAMLARAQVEAAVVFHSFDIEIVWTGCDGHPPDFDTSSRTWFTIRLRGDTPPKTAGPVSLDSMGRAFTSATHPGTLADVYYRAALCIARAHPVVETDALIGCVMVHELGHLLLGPGHTPDGIMRSVWDARDLGAIQKRWLRFNAAQRSRIRRELQSRNASGQDPLTGSEVSDASELDTIRDVTVKADQVAEAGVR